MKRKGNFSRRDINEINEFMKINPDLIGDNLDKHTASVSMEKLRMEKMEKNEKYSRAKDTSSASYDSPESISNDSSYEEKNNTTFGFFPKNSGEGNPDVKSVIEEFKFRGLDIREFKEILSEYFKKGDAGAGEQSTEENILSRRRSLTSGNSDEKTR